VTSISVLKTLSRKGPAIGLVVAGIVFFVLPMLQHVPQLDDLKLVEGHLISYSLHEERGRAKIAVYAYFRIEGYPGAFWNNALKDESANLLRGRNGVLIRTAYDPSSPYAGAEDATIESYGLSINGVALQSDSSAVRNERFLFHTVAPAFGILLIVLGCFVGVV
jgi:hypothetical protein